MGLLSLCYLSHYCLCRLIRLTEMFDKKRGRVIPTRSRIPWRRDKSARTQHVDSIAAGLSVSAPVLNLNAFQDPPARGQQISTGVSSLGTSQVLSFAMLSDAAQSTLPVVQAGVAVIPVVGSQLAAVSGGILTIAQLMDRRTQNSEGLDNLARRLCTLACRIANALLPTTQNPFEEDNRRRFLNVLNEVAVKLREMRMCKLWSVRLSRDIAACDQIMDRAFWEYTAFSQMNHLPAVVTTACVVVVDATGEEHNMLLEHCRSFEQLRGFLPGILEKCRPDKRHIQEWYIDRGQYDFVIDSGTNITQLTRESDDWSTLQKGTRIVLRAIITEVSRKFSPRYKCYCGKWIEVNVDECTVYASEGGFTIICHYCERRSQIALTTEKILSSEQGERSPSSDDGLTMEDKCLIRNFCRKQVMEERKSQFASCPWTLCLSTDHHGIVCWEPIDCETVPSHFRDKHGFVGLPHYKKLDCQWQGCERQLATQNYMRHVRERHLRHPRNGGHINTVTSSLLV